MSKSHLLVAFSTLLISLTAAANEALLEMAGGSAHPMNSASATVQMTSETVEISFKKNEYVVDGTFHLLNKGESKTILIGYPEFGYGYVSRFHGVEPYRRFHMWIDGEKVRSNDCAGWLRLRTLDEAGAVKDTIDTSDAAQIADLRQKLKADQAPQTSLLEETRWQVTESNVTENEELTSRVKYAAAYEDAGDYYLLGSYLYGSGASWSGQIHAATFMIHREPGIWLTAWPKCQHHSCKRERIGEYDYKITITDFKPQEKEAFDFQLSRKWQPFCEYTEFLYGDKPIPDDVLDLLDRAQCELLRKYILAFAGKPGLGDPFDGFAWYKPRRNFVPADLTETQADNLKRVDAYLEYLKRLPRRWN